MWRHTGADALVRPHAVDTRSKGEKCSMKHYDNIIENSAELWNALVQNAGLDLNLYDKPLLDDLADSLHISSLDFASSLETSGVTVEQLLKEFLQAITPYSLMMRDLLAMFSKASAQTTNNNIKIKFDFNINCSGLEFDLCDFRQWEEKFESVCGIALVDQWDLQSLLELEHAYTYENITYRYNPKGWDESFLPVNSDARRWLLSLESISQSLPLVPPPTVVDEELHDYIRRTWKALELVIRECDANDDTCNNNVQTELSSLKIGFVRHVVRNAFLIAENIEELNPPIKVRLASVFDNLTQANQETAIDIKEVIEILSLPVWKRRHDLYSAWVGSLIVKAMGNDARVHQAENSIIYSFRGTHLATLTVEAKCPIYLWAELRTTMMNPTGKGRKFAIQPDYVIAKEPVTHPSSSLLIVECKQYLHASKRNFVSALLDYATGHPHAMVLLVNYGATPNTIITSVPNDVRDRTFVIGRLRPRSEEALREFNTQVQNTLKLTNNIPATSIHITEDSIQKGQVQLTWGASPRDLDLQCKYIRKDSNSHDISFSHKQLIDRVSNIELDDDITTGFGPETIKFTYCDNSIYHFFVYNYTNDTNLAGCRAQIVAEICEYKLEMTVPDKGDGRYWDLFVFNTDTKTLKINNTIHSGEI